MELSGVDVIKVHRLLRNSVGSDRYILMTQDACADIRFPEKIEVFEGREEYSETGEIKTCTCLPVLDGKYLVPPEGAAADDPELRAGSRIRS